MQWKRKIILQIPLNRAAQEYRRLFSLLWKQAKCGKWCVYSGFCGFGLWLLYGTRITGSSAEETIVMYFYGYTGSLLYMAAYLICAILPAIAVLFFLTIGVCEEYYYTRLTYKSSAVWTKTAVIAALNAFMECTQILVLVGVLLINGVIHFDIGLIPTLFKLSLKLAVPRVTLSLLLYLWLKIFSESAAFFGIAALLVTTEPVCRETCRLFYFSSLDVSQFDRSAQLQNSLLIFATVAAILLLNRSEDVILEGDVKNGSG